jgi:hypothetical protein
MTGLPYCEFHARRAFQPPQPRRRDREIMVPSAGVSHVAPAPGPEASAQASAAPEKAAV